MDAESSGPLEALHRIDVACAVQTEQLKQIVDHLRILNGRVAKSEDRLAFLETRAAESRGAWKLIAIATSVPASIIGGIALWIAQHSGGK